MSPVAPRRGVAPSSAGSHGAIEPDAAAQVIEVLERIAADRASLASLDEESRRRLVIAAGLVSRPDRYAVRSLTRALRKKDAKATRARDAEVLSKTGARTLRRAPIFPSPEVNEESPAPPERPLTLLEPRKCYVCKAPYTDVHAHYDQLCPPCAELNWEKRVLTCDLRGRVALVTGARVKIGYFAALKLLRAGARVIVTTRFPRDAARRYEREPDYEDFRSRLSIDGLDLRHTPSVERFAAKMHAEESRLDFILHNACQTVRRPPGFYAHLVAGEAVETRVLASVDAMGHEAAALAVHDALFPLGRLDQDEQQIDLRCMNSWRLRLAEVPTVELLEVMLVNAIAPFVLSARLKPLMLKVASADKHIVNVSAMEGQFYRAHKTDKHPHTNMAKAALNMLTRTSAPDYIADGIHMNSVDTGWITDEDPIEIAAKKIDVHGFHPPLDVVDGAARICAPIFEGFTTGEHRWGMFFKDYAPTPW